MKMKKLIFALVAAFILAATTSCVNAASLNVDKTEYNVGDTVTVTFNMSAAPSVGIKLSYNADELSYIGGSTDIPEDQKGNFPVTFDPSTGKVVVSGFQTAGTTTVSNVTLTFKAEKAADASSINVTDFEGATGDALNTTSVSVKVNEAAVEPTPSDEPTTDNNEGNNGNNQSSTEAKNEDGKPSKLPKTGVPYTAIAVAGIVVVAAAIATVKIKNK